MDFLKQVAEYYVGRAPHGGLARYCMVFPNKRSGQFFERALQQLLPDSGYTVMPHVTTISELVCDLSGKVIANRLECMFCLYEAYRKEMGSVAAPFDHFVHWGAPLLNDFDDLDTGGIDYRDVFTNLDQLKEISTDHISDDLKWEIRRLLHIDLPDGDGDKLFRYTPREIDDDSVERRYRSLWNKLADIYEEYHRQLSRYNGLMVSSGRAYSLAAEYLDTLSDTDSLRYERYVMVGFVLLSKREHDIFKSLQRLGCADFWWDNASDVFSCERFPGPATTLINNNVTDFPPPQPIKDEALDADIRLVEIGSTVGQAKYARNLLKELHDAGDDEIRTAIVLPDETLLMPLLHGLGNRNGEEQLYEKINVTIGYKMRHSSIVSLMTLVARCLNHASIQKDDGSITFYREEVRDILSHPIIKTTYPDLSAEFINRLSLLPTHRVPSRIFMDTELAPLFDTDILNITANEHDQALTYIDKIHSFVDTLRETIIASSGLAGETQANDDDNAPDDKSVTVPLQSEFCRLYCEQLLTLRSLIEQYRESVTGSTVLYLINRLAASCVIPFTGEPLQGIQVMGMLETRCLDFDNLIILSANERVLPQRSRINSFIPNWLRNYHHMPTITDRETLSSYYFMRLLSRAHKVRLVYDTGSMAIGSNERSRFIHQLEMVYLKRRLPVTIVSPEQHAAEEQAIVVPCNSPLMKEWYGANGSRALSASSITKYIKCPLRFYLNKVAGLNDNNTPSDFMDYSEFGTIVHNTLDYLYLDHDSATPSLQNPLRRTRSQLLQFKTEVAHAVCRITNRDYLHREEHDLDEPLTGDAAIVQDVVKQFVCRAIDMDIKCMDEQNVDYLEIVECETPHEGVVTLDGVSFKFTFRADRIDRLNGVLRIIDYKTGGDLCYCSGVEKLVPELACGDFQHALMQLMLYCHAYTQLVLPVPEPIIPMIYNLKTRDCGFMLKIANDGSGQTGKKRSNISQQFIFTVEDEFTRDFDNRMAITLRNLLEDSIGFKQVTSANACRFCHYTGFCRRKLPFNRQ